MKRQSLRPGLTLLELVVVMAIMAVLATVAVVMTEGTVDQARYDATAKTLNSIDDAILGPVGQPEAASFLADTGRLPVSILDVNGVPQLTELLLNPGAIPQFGPISSDGVTLLAGWRGPYLTLGAGQTQLADGWGNPFRLFDSSSAMITAVGLPVASIDSAGGTASPYNAPVAQLRRADTSFLNCTVQGSIEDSVPGLSTPTPDMNPIIVKLFVPDFDSPHTGIRVLTYTTDASRGYTFVFPVPVGDSNYVSASDDSSKPFASGPKAIRIEQGSRKSVSYLKVPPGGMSKSLSFDIR